MFLLARLGGKMSTYSVRHTNHSIIKADLLVKVDDRVVGEQDGPSTEDVATVLGVVLSQISKSLR